MAKGASNHRPPLVDLLAAPTDNRRGGEVDARCAREPRQTDQTVTGARVRIVAFVELLKARDRVVRLATSRYVPGVTSGGPLTCGETMKTYRADADGRTRAMPSQERFFFKGERGSNRATEEAATVTQAQDREEVAQLGRGTDQRPGTSGGGARNTTAAMDAMVVNVERKLVCRVVNPTRASSFLSLESDPTHPDGFYQIPLIRPPYAFIQLVSCFGSRHGVSDILLCSVRRRTHRLGCR